MGLSNIEAMDGYTLTDALTPRQFAEMTDLDYEVVCLLYTAYAAQNENYGQIVGGIDDYTVPLMDLFLFAYDQEEAGYFSLEEDATEELNDMYQQLTDRPANQMLGNALHKDAPPAESAGGRGGDLPILADHSPGSRAVL